MADESNTEVFVYTEGISVPQDVVRVRVHPSVTVIPEGAFYERKKLEEVELCEGLLEIGKQAFFQCDLLTKITTIPSTVTVIHESAFAECFSLQEVKFCEGLREMKRRAFDCCICLKRIWLPNSIERIEEDAFVGCKATNFKIPPLMSTIVEGTFSHSESMCSIELPESITRIEDMVFMCCRVLRNMAIPPNADIELGTFESCTDLQQLFGTEEQIINALKHRFDNLPIHKMVYYQAYNNMTVDQLNNALDVRSGQRRSSRMKLDQTGNKQDCLGMTPLHILACSSIQSVDLYKVLITKYPENLITKDIWGALPLLYVVLRNAPTREAPSEIVQFLVESYKTLYPNLQFDWNEMVLNLARFEALALRPLAQHDVIRYVWSIQRESFPDQSFDCDEILEEAVNRWDKDHSEYIPKRSFIHLVRLSISARANRLGNRKLKHYIHEMLNKTYKIDCPESSQGRRDYIAGVQEHLVHCENEYRTLKEAITLLELALWKKRMNDHCQERNETRRIKRVKIDELQVRQQCRVGSGADIVIEHVLPYLVTMKE